MKLRYFLPSILILATISKADDAATSFHSRIQPLLQTYCTKCHGTEKQKARLNFAGTRTREQLADERDVWFRMLDKVESATMPPEDEKQPSKAERDALTAWVRGDFTSMLVTRQKQEGRSHIRRLTREEYAN